MDLFDYYLEPKPAKVEIVEELPIQLRDYQQEAVDSAFALFPSHPGVIIRSPTGTGKTAISSFIADKWLRQGEDYKVLVLAHERQLIQQFSDEIRDILGNRYTIAIEMSNQHCTGKEDIVVASRQTLLVRDAKDEFGNETTTSRLYKFDANKNWLVIFDECHRYARKLKSVRGIVEHFEQNPESKRLGVSATPERGCGTSLSGLFPGIASDYRMFDPDGGKCAVMDGWVVPYDQRFITVDSIDFKNIREVAKDFDEAQLQEVLGEQETLAKMVIPMLDLVGNRQNIIFNAGTEIAKKVALYINAKAGKDIAVSVDGTYPDEARKDIYRRFAAKEFQHLSVCGLCKEGYNNSSLSAVTIFRPTKSKVLCEQMRGRGCRVLKGVVTNEMTAEERRAAIAASPKPDCLVIDLVGATGLGDCASTAHIFANGKPDEVIERANENMRKKPDESHDVGDEIRRAEQELSEEREKARLEREAKIRREREEMEKRAKLAAEVRYQQRQVNSGHGAVGKGEKRKASMPFGKHKGEPIESLNTHYLKAFIEKMENLPYWLLGAIKKELNKRNESTKPPPPTKAKFVAHEAQVWEDVAALLRS